VIESRRFYRIPFYAKMLVGTAQRVYSGNCVNLSGGGAFVSLLAVQEFKRDTICRVVFSVKPRIEPLVFEASVKRIAPPSANPENAFGLGLSFDKSVAESSGILSDYLEEIREHYEVLGTLLSQGEPDIRTLQPLFQELYLPHFVDLAQLKIYVERVLKSIEIIEQQQDASSVT
jgi:hypothetical protein